MSNFRIRETFPSTRFSFFLGGIRSSAALKSRYLKLELKVGGHGAGRICRGIKFGRGDGLLEWKVQRKLVHSLNAFSSVRCDFGGWMHFLRE